MLHKVKEIFQKLFPNKEAPQPEAPYKIEPELKPPVPTPPTSEVEIEVVVVPDVIAKPKKPRTNQNGNRSKQRKTK
jgi:hypothetical protein